MAPDIDPKMGAPDKLLDDGLDQTLSGVISI
jgi:hypothetical protein